MIMDSVMEVLAGLAILLFAAFFPSATAFIILGIAVWLTIPEIKRRFRR
jgi:hypothetical protein